MTITIEAKPYQIGVEIPGYGKFKLKQLGAGQESEIRVQMNKAIELMREFENRYKDIIDLENKALEEKDEKKLDVIHGDDRYKAAKESQQEVERALEEAQNFATASRLKLWSAENDDELKRLFEDFSIKQIDEIYQQAWQLEMSREK